MIPSSIRNFMARQISRQINSNIDVGSTTFEPSPSSPQHTWNLDTTNRNITYTWVSRNVFRPKHVTQFTQLSQLPLCPQISVTLLIESNLDESLILQVTSAWRQMADMNYTWHLYTCTSNLLIRCPALNSSGWKMQLSMRGGIARCIWVEAHWSGSSSSSKLHKQMWRFVMLQCV